MVSPDGVAPSRIVGVHHKVQKFPSSTGSPRWSQKKGHKTVVVCGAFVHTLCLLILSWSLLHTNVCTDWHLSICR